MTWNRAANLQRTLTVLLLLASIIILSDGGPDLHSNDETDLHEGH